MTNFQSGTANGYRSREGNKLCKIESIGKIRTEFEVDGKANLGLRGILQLSCHQH